MVGLVAAMLLGQSVAWKPIPVSDPAVKLLTLVRQAQPHFNDLPEGSTYNYIWAENMMAWMVAQRSGLMSRSEACGRLGGLLKRVEGWETNHGFYFDAYDAATGKPTTDNVYFQGWWVWALILARSGYPEVAPLADRLLKRLDYDASGMISADHRFLAADRNAKTGKVSFYIQPTGDISGELRTPLIAYTYLTGDTKPWETTEPHRFIDVAGQPVLAVWHNFTFDPFYVHSCFPETGYFAKSYSNLVIGAGAYRKANGMTFYATRMEPLEAWNEAPGLWPNTENRVSKPWTAWLTDSKAPVMEKAWAPGYGLMQLFDNWSFGWGSGTGELDSHVIRGKNVLSADFKLEAPQGARFSPPVLSRLTIRAVPEGTSSPLVVKVNGQLVGSVDKASVGVVTLTPAQPIALGLQNKVTLETAGAWRVFRAAKTFRPMTWREDGQPAKSIDAVELSVFVDGLRTDRENPFAFLCRASGVYGAYPWKILAEKEGLGDRLVAWVGRFSAEVSQAHLIYNVDSEPVTVRYTLKGAELGRRWVVGPGVKVSVKGSILSWVQSGRTMVRLKKLP